MKNHLKKQAVKHCLSILFALSLIVGGMPMTAQAEGYGDKGYDTTSYDTFMIDGNPVFTYVTGQGGDIERISGADGDSKQQYKAIPSANWEFAYWSTYYVGPTTEGQNPAALLGYYYFSKPGDPDTAFNKADAVIQVNEETWAAGTFYLQAIFKPKVSVSINKDLYASATSIRGTSPATHLDNVFISGKSGYVPFGGAVEVTVTGFKDDYIVQGIGVHDGAPRNDFTYEIDAEHNELKVFFVVTRPTNVQIDIKIKEQIVSFDANTGSGTMEEQDFESGTEKALSAGTFTKAGYLFDGWNTKADGSGTAYSDQQKVTFDPENDGDKLTLYAQWKECTDHHVENGECTKCKASHEHSFTYKADDHVITETCTQNCDHSATAALEQDASISTIYTGSGIEPLKVSYSEKWEGGKLIIAYSNNINAGADAKGSITIGNATAAKTFTIEKAKAPVIEFPELEKPLTKGKKLKKAKLSFDENEYGEFGWAEPETILEEDGDYVLEFYPDEEALNNYDWTKDARWDVDRNALSELVSVEVKAAVGRGESGDSHSTQTGDNNNLWLWAAALVVSGTGIFKITQGNPKRKCSRGE